MDFCGDPSELHAGRGQDFPPCCGCFLRKLIYNTTFVLMHLEWILLILNGRFDGSLMWVSGLVGFQPGLGLMKGDH